MASPPSLLERVLAVHRLGLKYGIGMYGPYQPEYKAVHELVKATPLRGDELRAAAAVFWQRCAVVQAHFAAAPWIPVGDSIRSSKCTSALLGYFTLPHSSHYDGLWDADMNLLSLVVVSIASDADVRLVLADADGITSETMYHLLENHVQKPLIKMVADFPLAVCAASDALALASVQSVLVGNPFAKNDEKLRTAMWSAVRRDPGQFERRTLVGFACKVLARASDKRELDLCIDFLSALRSSALFDLGAGQAVANAVGECTTSKKRLRRVERLLARIYNPTAIDMDAELECATTLDDDETPRTPG